MARYETCPRCGEDVSVPRGFDGDRLRCPDCRASFQVGGSSRGGDSEERFRDRHEPERDRPRRRRDEDDEEHPRSRRDVYGDDEPWLRSIRRNTGRAKQKVQGAGILLMVVGVLLLLSGLAGWAFLTIPWLTEPDDPDLIPMTVVFVLGGFFALACGAISFLAGMRMREMRSYGLAIAATIVIFVFGGLACVPLAAAGIWPLIVLMDAEVKEEFRRKAEEGT